MSQYIHEAKIQELEVKANPNTRSDLVLGLKIV